MKNALGRLLGRSFEELQVIAMIWQVPLDGMTHNDAAIAIYREMSEKPAMRAVWGLLDAEAREFMRWLLEQRNNVAVIDELPERLARPQAEIEALLNGVCVPGLADVEEALVRGSRVVSAGDNLYNWGLRNLAPPSKKPVVSVSNEVSRMLGGVLAEMDEAAPPFDAPLTVLLDRLEQPALERIANRWHLPDLRYISKPTLIETLDSLLESRQVREQMVEELTPAARQVFDLLCRCGGRVDAGAVAAALELSDRDLRHCFGQLEARALAFETLWQDRRVLFVPRQVLDPEPVSAQEVVALSPVPAPAAIETRLPVGLPWDLLSMLAYLAQTEVCYNLHNGDLPRRVLKRINESFLHPGDSDATGVYTHLLLHFAETLGLTREEEKDRCLALGPRLEEWVGLSFTAQSLRLFQRWLDDKNFRLDQPQQFYIWRKPDPTAARKRLIKELAEAPLDTWLGIDALLARIKAGDPYLLYSKDELLRHGGVNALRDFQANWLKSEGALLQSMLTGVLCWFGVVDIGSEDGRPVAFRITRAGAGLIGHPGKGDEPQPEQKPFLIQPNFEVLVLAPEVAPLWTLLRCSDLVHHDRVSVYTLNKESILRARATGLSAAELQDFLTATSRKQAPQNVLQCVNDWSRGYKRATLQQATLLEVEEPEMLEELLSSRRLRGYAVRRLSRTVAMIGPASGGLLSRDDAMQRLAKELRAAGYFPQVVGDSAAPEKPRRRITATGSPTGTETAPPSTNSATNGAIHLSQRLSRSRNGWGERDE